MILAAPDQPCVAGKVLFSRALSLSSKRNILHYGHIQKVEARSHMQLSTLVLTWCKCMLAGSEVAREAS